MTDYVPAKTSLSRVFLIEGRARPDHNPAYQTAVRAQSPSKNFGDVTRIEAPDSQNYGKFVEIGRIRGEEERATLTLEGRYALDLRSELLRLARKGCAVDVQVHFGQCEDPSAFNNFVKDLILEDVLLVNYEGDDLGALQSGDDSAVNERTELSAKEMYEITPLSFAERAEDVMTNEGIDVVICDDVSCGDCADESDGCKKVFALTKAAGGSAGTPADIVYTLDGGQNFYAHDIDSLSAAEEPNALACLGDYVVVVSVASLSLHYAPKADFKAGTGDPVFTEVATGFVVGKGPQDIWSIGQKAFIVGRGGYVYMTTDPTGGVSVLDAGIATLDNLRSVHALSKTFAVAAGENGSVIFTEDGSIWKAVTLKPVGAGVHINTIKAKNKKEWWIGTSNGRTYYTLDQGVSWTEKAFPGSGAGVVYDIVMATDSVFYLSHATAAPLGRLLSSFDGGHSWVVLPNKVGILPDADRFTAIAACTADPKMLVAVGLAGNAADGIVLVGDMK